MSIINENTILRSSSELHPAFKASCIGLHKHLVGLYKSGDLKFRFELFETFRLPSRQIAMVAKGVSKAGPFQSAHQFGCAADFVPFLTQAEAEALGAKTGWYWPQATDEAYAVLKRTAPLFGLERPWAWDAGHIQLPGWRKKIGV